MKEVLSDAQSRQSRVLDGCPIPASWVRDIKIDLLMGNENPIVELFNKITDGIRVINCDVQNKEFIYFNEKDEWIFLHSSDGRVWAHYDRYWSLFETKFGLGYKEMQELTKFLIEESLKIEIGTPYQTNLDLNDSVRRALKRGDKPQTPLTHLA